MSIVLNAFEFFEGTRNSTQVLYRNHLFNKHSGITWRWISKTCTSVLNINDEAKVVTKEPTEHIGHSDIPAVQLAKVSTYYKDHPKNWKCMICKAT